MFVVKKNVVLRRSDGGAGLIKLEYFAGKTTGQVKMPCPDGAIAELRVDGRYFSAPACAQFNLPFPLTPESNVTARIIQNGGVLAFSTPAFVPESKTEEVKEERTAESKAYDDAQEKKEAKHAVLSEEFSEAEKAPENPDAEQGVQEKENSASEQAERKRQNKSARGKAKGKGRGEKTNFLTEIKDNLDELFDTYPKVEKLEEIVPNSAWVQVDGSDGGCYVVGIIADEEGQARYLCYGIPDKDNTAPPSVRPECRGWLPVEEEGAGYWVMYQDLSTGEIIRR